MSNEKDNRINSLEKGINDMIKWIIDGEQHGVDSIGTRNVQRFLESILKVKK